MLPVWIYIGNTKSNETKHWQSIHKGEAYIATSLETKLLQRIWHQQSIHNIIRYSYCHTDLKLLQRVVDPASIVKGIEVQL